MLQVFADVMPKPLVLPAPPVLHAPMYVLTVHYVCLGVRGRGADARLFLYVALWLPD